MAQFLFTTTICYLLILNNIVVFISLSMDQDFIYWLYGLSASMAQARELILERHAPLI